MNVMVVRDLIIHIEHTHIDTDRRTNKQIHIRFLARSKSHLTNRFSCNFRLDNLLALCNPPPGKIRSSAAECYVWNYVGWKYLLCPTTPADQPRTPHQPPRRSHTLQSHCTILRAGNLSRSHPWQWNHYLNRTHQNKRHPASCGWYRGVSLSIMTIHRHWTLRLKTILLFQCVCLNEHTHIHTHTHTTTHTSHYNHYWMESELAAPPPNLLKFWEEIWK